MENSFKIQGPNKGVKIEPYNKGSNVEEGRVITSEELVSILYWGGERTG